METRSDPLPIILVRTAGLHDDEGEFLGVQQRNFLS